MEDTDTTFDELEQHFGPAVRGFVAEVSDDKSLPKMERKKLQVILSTSKTARLIRQISECNLAHPFVC